MARLTLDQLMSPIPLKEREVFVPELGGSVLIREFTKQQAQDIKAEAVAPGNTSKLKKGEVDEDYLEVLLVVRGIVEPQLGAEHVLRMKQHPNGIVNRLKRAVLDLNGWTAEAEQAADDTFPAAEGRAD